MTNRQSRSCLINTLTSHTHTPHTRTATRNATHCCLLGGARNLSRLPRGATWAGRKEEAGRAVSRPQIYVGFRNMAKSTAGNVASTVCCMFCAAAAAALPVEMKAAAGEQMLLHLYLIHVCSLYITGQYPNQSCSQTFEYSKLKKSLIFSDNLKKLFFEFCWQ